MKAFAVLLALCAVAHADQPVDRPEAFEVDRDVPPPGQAELGFDAGAPVSGWALSAQLGYLHRPFRLHTTEVSIYPIDHRQTLALGVVVALGSTLIVDARLPMAVQTGARLQDINDEQDLDPFVIGDLGLGARLRLAQRGVASLFARGQLTLPTGDDHDFAGEARFTAAWMLIGRFTLPYGIVVAGHAGVRFRAREVIVADRLLGDELFGGVGATYELPPVRGLWCEANHVRVSGEVVGVLGNDVAGKRGPSPVEGRLGVISQIRPWLAVAARIGRGFDDHIGAPRLRAMVEVVYAGSSR